MVFVSSVAGYQPMQVSESISSNYTHSKTCIYRDGVMGSLEAVSTSSRAARQCPGGELAPLQLKLWSMLDLNLDASMNILILKDIKTIMTFKVQTQNCSP